MTDRLALWLGVAVLAAVGIDWAADGGAGLLFLARKFADLIEWVAFWR